LARRVQQAEDALKKNLEEQKTGFERLQNKLGKSGTSLEEISVPKSCKKVLDAHKQEDTCRKHLEEVKDEQEAARNARRSISELYHPFNLNTGEKRTPDQLKQDLAQAYDKLEGVSKKAECTDNQKEKLAKSRGMTDSLIQTLAFFWCVVGGFIADLQLNVNETLIFEQFLLPIEYLKMVEQRSGKQEKEIAKKAREALEENLRQRDVLGKKSTSKDKIH